jgi:kinesin family protein 18/19
LIFFIDGLSREKDLRMAFDCVFPGTATQDEVYSNTAKRLVHSVMEGYNASCFAYGATGTPFLAY